MIANATDLAVMVEHLGAVVEREFTQPVFVRVVDRSVWSGVEVEMSTRTWPRVAGVAWPRAEPWRKGDVARAITEAFEGFLAAGNPVSTVGQWTTQGGSWFNQATGATAAASTPSITAQDLRDALAKLQAAVPAPTPMVVPPQGSVTFQGQQIGQWVSAWNNLTTAVATLPTPPPEPDPMWSPIPVYGFRSWKARYSGGQLDGILDGNVESWPESTITAKCRTTDLSETAIAEGHAPVGHDAPHWGCHCGIYVCFDPNHGSVKAHKLVQRATFYSFDERRVVGLVELTGNTVEHERGARGQHGRIVALWVGEKAYEKVARWYPDVNIVKVPTLPETERTYEEYMEGFDGYSLSYTREADDELAMAKLDLVTGMEKAKLGMEERWLK